MRLASSLYYYEHGRYAADEATLVAYYQSRGLSTGDDPHGRRVERAAMALARHRATERRPKPPRYLPDDYLPMVRRHVTEAVRCHSAVKYRYRVEDEVLAVGLYTYTISAFADNAPGRMHTCSDAALAQMFVKMHEAGLLRTAVKDKEKRVAVRRMLQLAGLIVLRDGDHVRGGRLDGVADRFGLGTSHDRFAEFVERFGHVVDAENLGPARDARVGKAGGGKGRGG